MVSWKDGFDWYIINNSVWNYHDALLRDNSWYEVAIINNIFNAWWTFQ